MEVKLQERYKLFINGETHQTDRQLKHTALLMAHSSQKLRKQQKKM